MHDPFVPPLHAPPELEAGTALPSVKGTLPGPVARRWVDRLAAHECPAITARRARRRETTGVGQDPVVWASARGANVTDPDGNVFVDLTGGFGVASAGHGHPLVRARVHAQVDRLVHGLGDAFPSTARVELADALARLTPDPLKQTIFASSGSEAVEAALKTAVMATGRSGVLAFEGGYHGMSLGALAVSHYRASFREPFRGRIGEPADFLPFGCDEATLVDLLDRREAEGRLPGALLVEPIQGRGGVRVPPAGWCGMLRRVCDARGLVLVFDEIFTGFGRTGVLMRSGEAAGAIPDLLCLGKGMTSGFPVSACVGTEAVMGSWGLSRGEALHTSTFLGHPVGCAAALAVIELFELHGLLERGRALGERMGSSLSALCARRPDAFAGLRGEGAMRGLLVRDGRSMTLCRKLLERGFLVLPAGLEGEVISFTPPLTTTAAQWDAAVLALEACL